MLDDLDIKILEILQDKGRTKRSEIAEAIEMTAPTVSERLNKLEDKGVITGYYTKLDKKRFGYDITTFIMVHMESSKHYKTLYGKVEKHPNILECHSILGEGSHLLKVIAKNTDELEKVLAEIQSWPDVNSTRSFFVLSTLKETTKINIK
ncbi:MAG: Lrp/AsnC family transcriptional regulator [Ignavibacteriales bacterium]|jgi:Lrp/AsnC family leucine-responsive transcriptional regulator|nr:Lrp/AsnC family transcriptional regulator [Ignavibacteriaceae bacterium]NLH60521.1 Lrp/AsnC family transcriptional regulator [Ignavibacteriales bacterium]HOJ16987.1 Lrp/AsnC family transcriptional regulator [Ignavibacteriaceae bacterium]HPO55169.1 Lrp/AsnC family transcriptional regulator [Ignavibacteriaceae bacterium]